MDTRYFCERFNSAICFLPDFIKSYLSFLPEDFKEKVTEIRLRVNKDISFSINQTQVTLKSVTNNEIIVSRQLLENCFTRLCNFSVYSHQDEINNGFVTLLGGHRVGICGTVVYADGKIKNIKDISSLNIRVSKEIIGFSKNFLKYSDKGILILGPPACGKTTLLRDLVRAKSQEKRISLIDSRGEIAAVKNGVPQNDIGRFCDVLNMAQKEDGIEIAIRSLNPQIIAFDEISTIEEAKKVEQGLYAGVNFFITMHLGQIDEIYKKSASKTLLKSGAIKYVILLSNDRKNDKVFRVNNTSSEIFDLKEVNTNA